MERQIDPVKDFVATIKWAVFFVTRPKYGIAVLLAVAILPAVLSGNAFPTFFWGIVCIALGYRLRKKGY